VTALPVAEYAQSLGLLSPPKLRFLKHVGKKVVAVEVGGATDDAAALLAGGGSALSWAWLLLSGCNAPAVMGGSMLCESCGGDLGR
jgi:hypothetical protein